MQMPLKKYKWQMRSLLVTSLMSISVASCDLESFKAQCPALVAYSGNIQKKIADYVDKPVNDPEVVQMLKDYYKLREACRSFNNDN